MHPYQLWITTALAATTAAAIAVTFAAVIHAAEKTSAYLDRKRRQQADDFAKSQVAIDRFRQIRAERDNRIPGQRSS